MASTYTLNNGIELIGTGEQSGTWGNTTNTNLELLDTALDGQVEITAASTGSTGSPNSLPITDGSASNGRNRMVIIKSGTDLGGTVYFQLTPNDAEKIIYIRNSLHTQDLIVFQGTYSTSNDYLIPNGKTAVIFFDGGGSGAKAANVLSDLQVDALNVETDGSTTEIVIDNTATDGDPILGFALGGTKTFTMGVDDGDGDSFKIGTSAIGTNTRLTIDSSGNTAFSGTVTANAGVVVDNITIDGTEIDLSSGDLTIDVAGDIILDASGGEVRFSDGSQQEFIVDMNDASTKTVLRTLVSDSDLTFEGNDGGVGFTALTLDMSEAGAATFNAGATFGGNVGVGVTPETTSNGKSLTINRTVINDDDSGSFHISQNGYFNSAWKYVENGTAEKITFASGVITFDRAASNSGGADASLTWSESMRIDSSGRVMIAETSNSGYSNNADDLIVGDNGSSTERGISLGSTLASTIRFNDGSDAGVIEYVHSDNSMRFGTNNGTERMRIDSGGNVGIGCVPNSSSSGVTGLSVGDGASPLGSLVSDGASNTETRLGHGYYHDGSNFKYETANVGVAIYQQLGSNAGAQHIWFSNAGGSEDATFTPTERMRIDSSGNVGIGATSPLSLLDLTKTTTGNITGGSGNKGAVLTLHHEAQWENGYTGGDWLGALDFSTGDASAGEGIRASIRTTVDTYFNTNSLAFYTCNQGDTTLDERMRINANGNIQIGGSNTLNDWFNAVGSFGAKFQVETLMDNNAANYIPAAFVSSAANTAPAYVAIAKNRGGASNSVTSINGGDSIGAITFQGADGTSYLEAARIECGSESGWGADDGVAVLEFYTNSGTTSVAKRMTIQHDSGNNVVIEDGLTLSDGNLIIGGTGHGIDFSAQTATSASGAAASAGGEILDHYEEGTFTPTYVGTSSSIAVTLDSQVGFYTRIGDTVFFRIHLGSDAVSGGSSSNLQINGLPFATNSGRNHSGPVGLNYSWGSNNPYFWYSDANTSVMLLYKEGGANLTTNDLATGTNSNRIWIQGQYKV